MTAGADRGQRTSRPRVHLLDIPRLFRERDILVKRIFSQSRKMCEERGVSWGEVDLRWGVTEKHYGWASPGNAESDSRRTGPRRVASTSYGKRLA
ncbi:MAG TPA: hypothetical protein VMH22_06950 [bacterium]|nr:hypothetical protein [bacterium]